MHTVKYIYTKLNIL